MQDNTWVPIFAVALYGLGIVGGRAYFAKRERLHYRYTLAAWNAFLSIFSFIGMIRTAPHLFHNMYHMSLRDNLCLDPRGTYGSGSTGLWVQFFVLSKFP